MLLFINACMRGAEISRTFKLCHAFLQNRQFEEIDLTKNAPAFLTGEDIITRDELIDNNKLHSPTLSHAVQFSAAEEILIGAPYWDLSFPAALKAYIENVAVRNITFKTTPTGTAGLCRAKKLTYITTVGGYIGNTAQADHGTEYFRSLCKFFGIAEFQAFCAEGLDIATNDTEAIMEQKIQEIRTN
ncbi:MAG: NAD(P)H-dependent oxidoreductase [Defluviitaleaceae bacterium]|nr:NAD(P)H-dependent oxidoreductase [Defluviitaleaceae bacterium]